MYKHSGHENGIDWKVTPMSDRIYKISAKNTVNNAYYEEDYVFVYPNLFGHDVVDSNSIEELIDKAIKTVS